MNRFALGLLAVVLTIGAFSARAQLKEGDYVAVIGDSITEQKQYSVFIEDYLLMCKPAANLRATQFGWGGETASGFSARVNNDCLPFKPTVATTCYGMNDGGYSPMNPGKAKGYHDNMTAVVEKLKKGGVRFIVVGSPGCVDTDFFRRDPADPKKANELSAMYNKTLGELRDIAKTVAQEQGVAFANVFDAMYEGMGKAKAKNGPNYHFCGGDGFHPDANGHLAMAYAFLKGLGVDGNIGTITVDLLGGKAEATDGHKVLSVTDGSVEVESSRYPFCFYGDPKMTNSTAGAAEFIPFNDDLNRFKLIVTGVKGSAKITWGKTTKEFSGEQLAKGINLAAEFIENPFSDSFKKVDAAVRAQQNNETPLVKDLLHSMSRLKDMAPEESEAIDRIAAAAIKKNKTLVEASAAAVVPVKHIIKIETSK